MTVELLPASVKLLTDTFPGTTEADVRKLIGEINGDFWAETGRLDDPNVIAQNLSGYLIVGDSQGTDEGYEFGPHIIARGKNIIH